MNIVYTPWIYTCTWDRNEHYDSNTHPLAFFLHRSIFTNFYKKKRTACNYINPKYIYLFVSSLSETDAYSSWLSSTSRLYWERNRLKIKMTQFMPAYRIFFFYRFGTSKLKLILNKKCHDINVKK